MPFDGGMFGRAWDDIRDEIDRHLDADFLSRLGPYPDGASAAVHVATMLATPDMSTAQIASAKPAAVLPPNMNPADPDYGSRGLPPVRTLINACNSQDADACILPQYGFGSFDPRIGHNDSYNRLDPVARKGVDEHEKSHQEFQRRWYDDSFSGWQKSWAPLPGSDVRQGYDAYDPAQDEITAYKAEADYLENYLNAHPNDPNYSALQQRWLDRWQKIDDYKNGRLKR